MKLLADYTSIEAWERKNPTKKKILTLKAEGYLNREIAEMLHIEDASVKNILSTAFRQLEVRNTAEAVAKCIRLGIIE